MNKKASEYYEVTVHNASLYQIDICICYIYDFKLSVIYDNDTINTIILKVEKSLYNKFVNKLKSINSNAKVIIC